MANDIESMPVYYDQSIAGELAYKDYRQKVAMTRDITGAIARNAESINSRIVDAQIATTTAMYNNTQQLDGTLKAGFSDMSRQVGEMTVNMSMGLAALNSAVRQSAQAICDRLDTMNDILNNPSLTKTRELYRRAAVNYDKGFYEEAKNDLLEALAANKTDYISWFLLGKTYLFGASEFSNVIDLDAAVDALKNTVKFITPDARKQEDARALAAEMCFYLGLAQQARAMDALHAKNKDDCRSYLEQAGGSYSQSWDYSAKMLEARYNRARCKALLGDTPGAIADLETVVPADRNYCIKVCADNDFAGIAAEFAALIKKLKNAAFIAAQKDYERLKTLLAELAALGGKTDVIAPAFTGELPYLDLLAYADDFKRNIPIVEKAIADRKAAIAQDMQADKKAKERERFAQYRVCISASKYTVGLKADGTVVAVGWNDKGNYMDTSGWRGIVAVAASDEHTVGLKADGTVVTVEWNYDYEGSYSYMDTSGWRGIVAVAAGYRHTVGLKKDGTVVAVGFNDKGQCNVSDWRDMVAVAASGSHTVGLKADGTVVTVGWNYEGRCNVSSWRDIVAVAASEHTVGLKADGTVVAVGFNRDFQCNVSGWRDIVAVAADQHTVGLKADGRVVAVGFRRGGRCDVDDWSGIGPFSQEQAKKRAEQDAREAAQVARWKAQGLCAYCGGKLGGLLTKKCKECGKEKNY